VINPTPYAQAGATIAAGSGISLGEGLILFASFATASFLLVGAVIVPVRFL
jgi:hypothetical protein